MVLGEIVGADFLDGEPICLRRSSVTTPTSCRCFISNNLARRISSALLRAWERSFVN